MSCTKCERVPANREHCFERMSDGRAFTNWKPSCTLYANQKDLHKLGSSYDQRMWMINNAEKLMKQEKMSLPSGACAPCFAVGEQGTMLPESDVQQCSTTYCQFSTKDNMGLGLGRNFASLK